MDIAFIGEPWRSGDSDIQNRAFRDGTQLHNAYILGAGDHFEDLIVGYWRKNRAHLIQVVQVGRKRFGSRLLVAKLLGFIGLVGRAYKISRNGLKYVRRLVYRLLLLWLGTGMHIIHGGASMSMRMVVGGLYKKGWILRVFV